MGPKDKSDYQTANLFMTLGILTILFVLGIRLVLFVPIVEGTKARIPASRVER